MVSGPDHVHALNQMEFLLVGAADGTAHLADPLGDFRERISVLWHLPLGQQVHVDLRDCELPWLQGRLELAQGPICRSIQGKRWCCASGPSSFPAGRLSLGRWAEASGASRLLPALRQLQPSRQRFRQADPP